MPNKEQVEKYIEVSLSGAARGLLGLPIEHPFDCVKTRWQAVPTITSCFDIIRDTYKHKGIKGFYAGAVPNAIRVSIKQAYRWPLMFCLPPFFKQKLFSDQDKYPVLQKGLTGLTIASIESLILTPLEKCKVWLMTNKDKNKNLKTLLLDGGNPIQASLRELNIVYPRQIIAWSTFLMADEALKGAARQYHEKKPLPFTTLFGISIAVGAINTAATMPFDMVKTLVQKENPLENKGIYKTMRIAYNNFGARGLYVGWQIRMTQYMVQSFFTVNLLEKLENKFKTGTPSNKI